MIVEQIWIDNPFRNFNYLVACPETGEALAIDPLDDQRVLACAKERGLALKQIVNTHEHYDHIGGNAKVSAATGAKILAHAGAGKAIPNMDRGLQAGDIVKVGNTVELRVLDTPGHTMSHVCLLSEGDTPALFCGDTLFNAGAGNCHNGGHPNELYETFVGQLSKLPDSTRVYPGHDYIENNLRFTLDREPANEAAAQLLEKVTGQDPHTPKVTTLALEKQVNTFLRLQSPGVIEQLIEKFPELGNSPSPRDVFVRLRALRNAW